MKKENDIYSQVDELNFRGYIRISNHAIMSLKHGI